jgi:acyl-CoA thioester hydrolase
LHAVDFRLSYADCDPAGIVYFAAYYRWLERTYSEWTWMMGLGVDRMRPLWGAWTVSKDSGCTYHVPGVLFDHLWCVMRCGRIGTTSSTMAFDIIRSRDEVLVAEGRITLVFLDDSGRPVPVPEAMRIALTGL